MYNLKTFINYNVLNKYIGEIMLVEIFGKCPQIKVINFLLAHPFDDYTKQQIAVGSNVSRSTLDNFINIFIENDILIFSNSRYKLNFNSSIVKKLDGIQEELVQNELFKQKFNENSFVKLSDEVLDKLLDENEEDVNLDEIEREIELTEEILVNKYDFKYFSRLNNDIYNVGGLIHEK